MEDPLTSEQFKNARKYAERGYNSFMKNLNGMPINEYFNVKFLDIYVTKSNDLNYNLSIKYIHSYPQLIKLNLPDDAIRLIKSYVERNFTLTTNIFYRKDTPFKAPLWSLTKMKTLNIDDNKLRQLIQRHNEEYKHDWSTLIILEKDILYFIERVICILTSFI